MKFPLGFRCGGIAVGIKQSQKKDLGLIVSERPMTYAGVFTQNKIRAFCVDDNQNVLNQGGTIRAIVVNSGNANACSGEAGKQALVQVKDAIGNKIQCSMDEVLTCSTGVIGVPLPSDRIVNSLDVLWDSLTEKADDFSEAILTTDLVTKTSTVSLGNKSSVLGVAKGSGMIHPNMATMLAFLLIDADIEQSVLQRVLSRANSKSFNQISVDGDTSTNDMVMALSNGMSEEKVSEGELQEAIEQVCVDLAKQIARDGEGATKLVECTVKADSLSQAQTISKGIVASSLVKTAIYGNDPNWGRILAAVGQYAEGDVDLDEVDLYLQDVPLLRAGIAQEYSKSDLIAKMQTTSVISIQLNLSPSSPYAATAWGCDLSYDYVKINAEYTT